MFKLTIWLCLSEILELDYETGATMELSVYRASDYARAIYYKQRGVYLGTLSSVFICQINLLEWEWKIRSNLNIC